MQQPHRVTLHVVRNAKGNKVVVCEPSKRESNRVKVGAVVRFEAADPSNAVAMGFGGNATLTPGQEGAFFQEFTASTPGTFEFAANLTLPDLTVVEWEPGSGGQGEVQP